MDSDGFSDLAQCACTHVHIRHNAQYRYMDHEFVMDSDLFQPYVANRIYLGGGGGKISTDVLLSLQGVLN